jgi:hypothetical protein
MACALKLHRNFLDQPMTFYLLANHLLNFVAPAAFLALLMVGLSALLPFSKSKAGGKAARLSSPGWRLQLALVFAVNLLVTVCGLVVFGHDGRLLTYAAMALAAALVQWLLLRGWKV